MKSRQTGFTLIELVMVIVILGVLAAVAIPKFTNLSADANLAAVQSVAGSLAAGAATNYAARSVKNTNGVAVANCAAAANTLQGGLPTAGGNYVISDAGSAAGLTAITPGNSSSCTLTFTPTSGTAPAAQTFSVTGIA